MGVVMRPQASPKPNMDVDTGYVATFAPFSTSISFWSGTLMISCLEESTGVIAKTGAIEMRLKITGTRRNMRKPFTREFRLCHAGIAAVARELSKFILDQRLETEERQT